MTDLEKYFISCAQRNLCPGCGPSLVEIGPTSKRCNCCGWIISILQGGEEISIEQSPPDIEGQLFNCWIDHPDHRENWPKPDTNNQEAEPLDELEKKQLENLQDINHPWYCYYWDENKKCSMCLDIATHKIKEELPFWREPIYSYVCCACYSLLFGAFSHPYAKAATPS
jgi:hypothetical protein